MTYKLPPWFEIVLFATKCQLSRFFANIYFKIPKIIFSYTFKGYIPYQASRGCSNMANSFSLILEKYPADFQFYQLRNFLMKLYFAQLNPTYPLTVFPTMSNFLKSFFKLDYKKSLKSFLKFLSTIIFSRFYLF